jgi:hypothetical protein
MDDYFSKGKVFRKDHLIVQRVKHKLWLLVIPLLLLVTLLGAHGFNADVIWGDESFSLLDAGLIVYEDHSPQQIWNSVSERNPVNTPMYFMLLSAWGHLVGEEIWLLRAMSLMFGLLAVAFLYRVGRDFFSPTIGLYAACILGTSFFFVNYLHEIRVFALVMMFTASEVWFYLRIAERKGSPNLWEWLGLILSTAGLLYCHYFAVFPIIALGLYHLLFISKNRRWWGGIIAVALGGALYLPWVPTLVSAFTFHAKHGGEQIAEEALRPPEALLTVATLFSNHNLILFAIVCAAAVFVRGQKARKIFFLAVVLLILLLVANVFVPVIKSSRIRYSSSLWPVLALPAALSIEQIGRWNRLASLIVLGAWIGFGIWNAADVSRGLELNTGKFIFPVHYVAQALEEVGQPQQDIVVVYLPDDVNLARPDFYDNYIAPVYFYPMGFNFTIFQAPERQRLWREAVDSALEDVQPHNRVWVAYMSDAAPSRLDGLERRLDDLYTRCAQTFFRHNAIVHQFVRAEAVCISG